MQHQTSYRINSSTPLIPTSTKKKTVLLNGLILELMGGVEPPTASLRMRCSAIKLHQQIICSAIKHLSEERRRRRSRFPSLRQCRMIRKIPYISVSRSVIVTERAFEFNGNLCRRIRFLILFLTISSTDCCWKTPDWR